MEKEKDKLWKKEDEKKGKPKILFKKMVSFMSFFYFFTHDVNIFVFCYIYENQPIKNILLKK